MAIPLIHQTDLFRPHEDPDDHWDLACVYALASRGYFDLRGILIDYPPKPHYNPDVVAIAQMNHLHGLSVPFAVGSSQLFSETQNNGEEVPFRDSAGVRFLLDKLQAAPEPAFINIVGSCRDVALASQQEPQLFERQCAGIYLNAGCGDPTNAVGDYNTSLDPKAFAAIFDAPCPVFWLPCFQMHGRFEIEEHGSYWSFVQAEVLESLTPELQRYFASALSRSQSSDWLAQLRDGVADVASDHRWNEVRWMWCTAGFFHAAGFRVLADGTVVRVAEADEDGVFAFDRVRVTCNDEGITRWETVSEDTKTTHYKFRVCDTVHYATAMKNSLRFLLSGHIPTR